MADSVRSLANIASEYHTVVTPATKVGTEWQLLIGANPNRIFIRINTDNSPGSVVLVYPGPVNNDLSLGNLTNTPIERKFYDAPSAVVGEWYFRSAPGIIVVVEECIYNRG